LSYLLEAFNHAPFSEWLASGHGAEIARIWACGQRGRGGWSFALGYAGAAPKRRMTAYALFLKRHKGNSMTLFPRPPWFAANKRADKIGRRLVEFRYRPSWLKLPGIFLQAVRG
jgi:hypothetical protein